MMRTLRTIALVCLLAAVALAQTTVSPFLTPDPQFSDGSGNPCSGCLLFSFAAGTSTPAATYSDSLGTVLNANPVVMDSTGHPSSGAIFLTSASYKFVLKTAAGTQLWSVDQVTWANLSNTFTSLTSNGTVQVIPSAAATSGANQSSPQLQLCGNFWNGSASAADCWNLQDVLGTGANPTSTLQATHSGSSGTTNINLGTATVSLGGVTNSGNESVAGTLSATGGGTLGGNFGGNPAFTGNPSFSGSPSFTASTVGSSLPSVVSNALTPFHNPFIAQRSTTESGQPDHYAGALVVNYQGSGGTNLSGKGKPLGLQVEGYFNSTGEHGNIYSESYSTGSGDNVAIETFAYGSGMCSDSGGECLEGGRFQADNTQNTLFSGTVATASDVAGSTTITYSSSTNELTGRGKDRVLIRTDGGTFTTGTISSQSGIGTITFVGSGTGWTALGTGAHSDLCLSIDADTVSSFKFVVPITSITDDTHLVVTYAVNAVNQSWPSNQAGAYHIWKCSIISDVSTFGQVVVTDGYTGWAAGQTYESPIGYSQHQEGVRALVNPAIPWGNSFPLAIFHGVNLSTRRGWGLWFDSSFGLSTGLKFQNTWGGDPQGNDSTGGGIDFAHNPGNIIVSRDNSTATNIFNNVNVGDVFSYNPSTRIFAFGTTGLGNKLQINPQTGVITPVSAGSADIGTTALPFANLFLGAAATNNIKLTGTATGSRTATFPDATGEVAVTPSSTTVLQGTATLTYTAIAAQTCQEQSITVTSASTTNFGVYASPRATLGNTNLSWSAWVSASGTVSVRVCNQTAGSITPSAVAWGTTVWQ